MTIDAKIVSKVLVLDSNAACYDSIKAFCDSHNLIGLKVQHDNIMSVLKSNVDLGAILLAEEYGDNAHGGVPLAREIHEIRPDLPIFLRRETSDHLADFSEKDGKLFSAAYTINGIAKLHQAIDEFIFSLVYPSALVRGIAELTRTALESQFRGMGVEIASPYIVRDRIIFGEIFTLIPIEGSWCRGYMMLQAEEESLLRLVKANKTYIDADSADDFRNLNNVLGEITNLIWGAFKNKYINYSENNANLAQVPLVINHLHRYISFGSEDPQLCFKYTLLDGDHQDEKSMVIYQRFVFNLSWSPEDFKENQFSTVDELFDSGELELF